MSYVLKSGIAFFMLLTGTLLYLMFRSDNLLVFSWIDSLELTSSINALRNVSANIKLGDFYTMCLPDGLYVASYMLFMDTIWKDSDFAKEYIMLSLPIFCILSEFGQLIELVPGTFDIYDIICYVIPILIYELSIYGKFYKTRILSDL